MRIILSFFLLANFVIINAQPISDSVQHRYWSIEPAFHLGQIVKISGDVPQSVSPNAFELNVSVQTNGSKEWHHIFGFPKVGLSLFNWNLGNRQELGKMTGFVPNITFNTQSTKWYSPRANIGLGLALFEKQYNYFTNPANFYIGSKITAFAYASAYIQPRISNHLSLKTGVMVSHCSNSHYQVPNMGINLPSVFIGIAYEPRIIPKPFAQRNVDIPKSKIMFNIRTGIGVHELADTKGPVNTAKYAIYVNDIFVSKRYGKASNVQLGIEIKHYNSFYNYIVRNNFFKSEQKLKATVIGLFVGHELMISHLSILAQGGVNVYNKFYNKYVEINGEARDFQDVTKKLFSTRLGVQYYFLKPKYCTRSNVYIGAYIKANFGQADFLCSQIGFVF